MKAVTVLWLTYAGVAFFRIFRYGKTPMAELPLSFRMTSGLLLSGSLLFALVARFAVNHTPLSLAIVAAGCWALLSALAFAVWHPRWAKPSFFAGLFTQAALLGVNIFRH